MIIKCNINSSFLLGLTLIVGQVLLLSLKEEVFWIFVLTIDMHIQLYFSASMTQIEVNAALLSHALEVNDLQIGRKVFVDMDVLPGQMCTPWYDAIFFDVMFI